MSRPKPPFVARGLRVGLALGIAIGAAVGNAGLRIALGIALGAAVDTTLDLREPPKAGGRRVRESWAIPGGLRPPDRGRTSC